MQNEPGRNRCEHSDSMIQITSQFFVKISGNLCKTSGTSFGLSYKLVNLGPLARKSTFS